jgi:hypothetical protein
VAPGKRWLTVATAGAKGWRLADAEPVGPPETLLSRLRTRAAGDGVALGVDFPIGLPIAYVQTCQPPGANFFEFLGRLQGDDEFFSVAASLADVSGRRPFYPQRGIAGMTRAAHAAALGLVGPSALSRACDRATPERGAGAPLFWTLGANQVGKAALHGWRHLLVPALCEHPRPMLWPFDGAFRALVAAGHVVFAETYPAEALRHLTLRLRGSKRRQADRRNLAEHLFSVITDLDAVAEPDLAVAIGDGFGSAQDGEDRFDCLLGVLCVLNVLSGRRTDEAPERTEILFWEGWVLGQIS